MIPPLALGFSGWWIAAWAVGFGGAVVAALLLLWIISLGRRLARQADDIAEAIKGGRTNTDALFDIAGTNHLIDRITRGLRRVREGA